MSIDTDIIISLNFFKNDILDNVQNLQEIYIGS